MLKSLLIQNYALIAELNIDFDAGFTVLTGETGAGKSIILGAVNQLLGQRAEIRVVRNGRTKCIIEAHFSIGSYHIEDFFRTNEIDYDDDCILRREIYASGKSRGFINDTPVSLSMMKELGSLLIDVHSQHQNLTLNTQGFQLNVLDILATDENELANYKLLFREYVSLQKKLNQMLSELAQNKDDEDYIKFQLGQLEDASLKDGEQVALEQELALLANAGTIKSALYTVSEVIHAEENGVINQLGTALNALNGIVNVYKPSEEIIHRLESVNIELKDIDNEMTSKSEDIEFNDDLMSEINDRLNLIYSLENKHHVNSVEELLELKDHFRSRLDNLLSAEDHLKEIQNKLRHYELQVTEAASVLTKKRKISAQILEKKMTTILSALQMPNVKFKVEINSLKSPCEQGMDEVSFLFSANKNTSLQKISAIASGGEIARVMLALKAIIAGSTRLPTIIFDEIDTGVSGAIADKMADIMLDMCKDGCQVISITHLPQIAARGQVHLKVFKEDNESETNSRIIRIENEERVVEIAHMLSGAVLSEAALNNARSLLEHRN